MACSRRSRDYKSCSPQIKKKKKKNKNKKQYKQKEGGILRFQLATCNYITAPTKKSIDMEMGMEMDMGMGRKKKGKNKDKDKDEEDWREDNTRNIRNWVHIVLVV